MGITKNQTMKINMKGQNTDINQTGQASIVSMKGHNGDSDDTMNGAQSDIIADDEDMTNVSIQIKELWTKEAAKDLGYVPLKKLFEADIYNLSHRSVNWENIDPYSSLTEEESTVDTLQSQPAPNRSISPKPTETTKEEKSAIGTIYFMCKCKQIRHSNKLLRQNRNIVNNTQMDCTSESSSHKRKKGNQ